jgi:hypothetical protein
MNIQKMVKERFKDVIEEKKPDEYCLNNEKLLVIFCFFSSGKLVPLMENGVLHVSILTILAVTFERYNALCHPFKHRMASTISATVKTIIGIWTIGTILSLPFLIMKEHENAMFYDGSPIKVGGQKIT